MPSKTAPTPALRTDTQLIPVPGLRPLPARLDPRASVPAVLVAAVRALLVLVAVTAAVVGVAALATVWVLSGAPDALLLVLAVVLLASYPAVAAAQAPATTAVGAR